MYTHFDYKLLTQQAGEVVDLFTDLCGGQLMLAIYVELLNEFIAQGMLSSAQLLVKKLYDIADIPPVNKETANEPDSLEWIPMFAELLADAIDDLGN